MTTETPGRSHGAGARLEADMLVERVSRTKGRGATEGVIPGRFALSVGKPELPEPPGWRWTALSEVAQLESGHTPSRKHPEYWDDGIPWIGIKDAVDNHGRTIHNTYQHVSQLGLDNSSARLLPPNTVCLSRTASVGYVVVMGRSMATSQDFVNWVCGPKLSHEYLKYILVAERESLLRFASGTTHQTIYYPEAKAFHALLPPVKTQEKIAEIVKSIDDKIELNRRTNETLEAMARALFKSWFVDFDPVRAKAAGRKPVGMDEATAALFPDGFEQSERGEIPRGWRATQLKSITSKIGSGSTPRGGDSAYLDQGISFIRSQNVYDSDFVWDGLACIGDAEAKRLQSVSVAEGDVLLNITGASILRTCIVETSVLPARVNQHVAIVRPSAGIPPQFIHFQLLRTDIKSYLLGFDAGASRQAVTKAHIESVPILLPNQAVLDLFSRSTTSALARIQTLRAESRSLAALRDALLPRLLSGELRVPEAERAVGAVL